jgi:ABC-2 type transport system permease protein
MIRSNFSVARAIAGRSLRHAFTNPALAVPSIIFPLFFLIAFAGGLQKIGDVPGFDFPSGYTAFQFVFVFLQSAAFGGIFTGFGVAADWESGFVRRLLLGAPHRTGMIFGYIFAGLVRWLVTSAVIWVAALIAGMQVGGNGVDIAGMIALGLLVNAAATLWGVGLSMRTKSMQAMPLMQIPVFITLFLAPVYVPLHLLKGWIHSVASWNPITAIMNSVRGFISGEPAHTALAFACGAGMVALLAVWGVTSLRKAERGE